MTQGTALEGAPQVTLRGISGHSFRDAGGSAGKREAAAGRRARRPLHTVIPSEDGHLPWSVTVSATSRTESRTGSSHGTPRRQIGVEKATRLAFPARAGTTPRVH